jgi:hypothetical protein
MCVHKEHFWEWSKATQLFCIIHPKTNLKWKWWGAEGGGLIWFSLCSRPRLEKVTVEKLSCTKGYAALFPSSILTTAGVTSRCRRSNDGDIFFWFTLRPCDRWRFERRIIMDAGFKNSAF